MPFTCKKTELLALCPRPPFPTAYERDAYLWNLLATAEEMSRICASPTSSASALVFESLQDSPAVRQVVNNAAIIAPASPYHLTDIFIILSPSTSACPIPFASASLFFDKQGSLVAGIQKYDSLLCDLVRPAAPIPDYSVERNSSKRNLTVLLRDYRAVAAMESAANEQLRHLSGKLSPILKKYNRAILNRIRQELGGDESLISGGLAFSVYLPGIAMLAESLYVFFTNPTASSTEKKDVDVEIGSLQEKVKQMNPRIVSISPFDHAKQQHTIFPHEKIYQKQSGGSNSYDAFRWRKRKTVYAQDLPLLWQSFLPN